MRSSVHWGAARCRVSCGWLVVQVIEDAADYRRVVDLGDRHHAAAAARAGAEIDGVGALEELGPGQARAGGEERTPK